MKEPIGDPVEIHVRFGADGEVNPLGLTWQRSRLVVLEVGRSWRDAGDPYCTHVLVRTAGGDRFELVFDAAALRWSALRLGPETCLA